MSIASIRQTCPIYLFSDPLNKSQSLLQRVANVAFHILTLGIPLALYKIYTYCFKPPSVPVQNPQQAPLPQRAVASVQNAGPIYSPTELRVLELARVELDKYPTLCEANSSETSRIAVLFEQYMDNSKPLPDDESVNRVVILSCALGLLALTNIESYVNQRRTEGFHFTKAKAIAYSNYIQAYPALYHFMRSNSVDDFYTPNTLEYSWRMLYNEYCNRLEQYASREELVEQGMKLELLTPDLSADSFTPMSAHEFEDSVFKPT